MPLLTRGTRLRVVAAACVTVYVCLLSACPARGDYAVLRSGQRLHVTGYERSGDTVRLDLPGGSVTVQAADLVSIEPEEVFAENPKPELPRVELNVPYANEIRAAAAKYALDPKLIASVIAVESNFNRKAVSPKSSFGLMQLQSKTAAELSVGNVFDPQQNIAGGSRYLRQLLDHYSQNLVLALAAYNAGPDRVQQYGGVPPFRETYDYIRRVTDKLSASPSVKTATSSLALLP